MKARLSPIFALLLICTGAGIAQAQTPDGLPPALETVCDAETGAAYGHCNAYCEAMDCELANDGDPSTEPHASANACAKVRAKFQQATGRDVPCELTCPCADPAVSPNFAAILTGQTPVVSCGPSPFPLVGGIGVNLADDSRAFTGEFILGGWFCGPVSGSVLPISPEQGQYCAQLLEQAANSQGVTCN